MSSDSKNCLQKTYAVIILQHWPLKDKKPSLPTTKVLSTFGKISFFVANLHDGLFLFSNDVGGKKGDNFIIVFHRQFDQRLQIVFENGL